MRVRLAGWVVLGAVALAGCSNTSNFQRGANSEKTVPGYVGIGMSGAAQPASNTMVDTRTGASPLPDFRQTGPSRGVNAPSSWSGNKQ